MPAYGYVFHEYINNFMGNQNGVANVIDLDKCPDNFLLRIAHSFAAGDMLTLVLAKDGQVHWDWGTSWDAEYPQQQPVKTLVRNLNAWRTGAGKPYLHLGRMLKPYGLVGVGAFDLPLRSGEVHHYPSLFTSRWQAPDGSEGAGDSQLFANAAAMLCRLCRRRRSVHTAGWNPALLWPVGKQLNWRRFRLCWLSSIKRFASMLPMLPI